MAVSSSGNKDNGNSSEGKRERGAKASLLRALINRTWALLDEAAPILSGELQAHLQPLLEEQPEAKA